MTRAAMAAEEADYECACFDFCECESDDKCPHKCICDPCGIEKKARVKYDIPEGVHLMIGERLPVELLKPLKPFVKRWVEGSLTRQDVEWMHFFFFSWSEIDYAWVFLDKPAHFYYGADRGEDIPDIEALDAEFKDVGSRAKKKRSGESFYNAFLADYFGPEKKGALKLATLAAEGTPTL
jgi:hypothetical protein